MKNDKVIVLGSGKIAAECIRLLVGYGSPVTAIEQGEQPLSAVRLVSEKHARPYRRIAGDDAMTAYLESIKDETLVVSANNNYLFPRRIVEKRNLRIVNFHNALLPEYPGRNAPTWVIYEQEAATGITWHMVNDKVDAGDILIQKAIPIDSGVTALQLSQKCMDTGIEAFGSLLPGLLQGGVAGQRQELNRRKKVYRSYEVPNQGYLDLAWPTEKMSAFLRALDYGIAQIFPYPKMKLHGHIFSIVKYKISETDFARDDMLIQQAEIATIQDGKRVINMKLQRG